MIEAVLLAVGVGAASMALGVILGAKLAWRLAGNREPLKLSDSTSAITQEAME